jgi:hypothetical protein
MKPNSETVAIDASEPIRPMFGPSGRLDRAHAAVVRRVHVAHLDRRALAREAARAERREAARCVRPGERVRLLHELRQLRRAEELLQRRDDRAGC